MKNLPIVQIDAFTTVAYGGNPCAVVFDADRLTAAQMLAIAKEMNLSETAFVLTSDKADFRARYFTPAEEIPLAGHPTIATVYALIQTGRLNLIEQTSQITLQLEAGVIEVEIDARDEKRPLITMSQMKPQFLTMYDPAETLPAFGLSPDDLLPGAPIQTVSTGTPQLMIPLRGLESLRRIRLDIGAYTDLRTGSDFFSPHLFVLQGVTPAGKSFARHFGVPPDTPEDPFTGSATGGMAAYCWHRGLLDTARFVAEQGHWMGRPGQAQVEVVGPRDNIETVKVGGYAVEVMSGQLAIPPQ